MLRFSKQQERCLSYLVQGLTAKEIGIQMGLSRRTIEYYLAIIKEKTGIRKKSQLINFYRLYGLRNDLRMESSFGEAGVVWKNQWGCYVLGQKKPQVSRGAPNFLEGRRV